MRTPTTAQEKAKGSLSSFKHCYVKSETAPKTMKRMSSPQCSPVRQNRSTYIYTVFQTPVSTRACFNDVQFCRGGRCPWSWRIQWAEMSPISGKLMSRLLCSGGGSASAEWPREEAAGSASHYQNTHRTHRRRRNIETKTAVALRNLQIYQVQMFSRSTNWTLTIRFPWFPLKCTLFIYLHVLGACPRRVCQQIQSAATISAKKECWWNRNIQWSHPVLYSLKTVRT